MKAFILLTSAITCSAQRDGIGNESASLQPPINLDANLRRALLKALTELENEENIKLRNERNNMIFEKAPASSLSFTADTLSTDRNTTATTENTNKPIIIVQRSRGVQSRPITSFESTKLDPVKDAENILASASNSFTTSEKPQPKSQNQRQNSKGSSNANSLVNYVRISSVPSGPVVFRPTQTTTTTTTEPTTTTEESEAKVEDVQFFTAPLVAAFTVHQDERGVPKSVIPLYRQVNNNVPRKQAQNEIKLSQELLKQQAIRNEQEALRQQDQFRQRDILTQKILKEEESLKLKELRNQQELLTKQELLKRQQELQRQQNLIKQNEEELKQRQLQDEQLRYQLRLQEKQRRLEEEIKLLRQRQEQQDYLLRHQQRTHEDQLREQKQKLLNEQFQVQTNQQNIVPIAIPVLKTPTSNQFNNPSKTRGTFISLQPSITFSPAALPLNAQILPIKNAVEFRQPFMQTTTLIPLIPVSQHLSQQLPQQFSQQIPQSLSQQLSHQPPQHLIHQQPPLVTSVPHFDFVQTLQPQTNLGPPQSNRIFRQETGTGNFFNNIANNNHLLSPPNHFNTFAQPNFHGSRIFRSNLEGSQVSADNFQRVQAPVISNHLSNLLYNSGVYHGRQYEDLNIVSKVLSLNHLGNDQRFDSSNINEKRSPAPH